MKDRSAGRSRHSVASVEICPHHPKRSQAKCDSCSAVRLCDLGHLRRRRETYKRRRERGVGFCGVARQLIEIVQARSDASTRSCVRAPPLRNGDGAPVGESSAGAGSAGSRLSRLSPRRRWRYGIRRKAPLYLLRSSIMAWGSTSRRCPGACSGAPPILQASRETSGASDFLPWAI